MQTSGPTDSALLTEWLTHHSEHAFHQLVNRHAGLVHATARRACGDESLAAEVSQLTFITLTRKARSLLTCPSIAGWLHRTAMLHAKNLRRREQRENRKRQHLLATMETQHSHRDGTAWQDLQPVLDSALAALSSIDREAILLRFYRSMSVHDVAATLGIATAAAQKRIDRATTRLRAKLARRGIQASGTLATTLATGLATDAQAATPALISILTTKALAAAPASVTGLAGILAILTAAMKTTSLIPPAAALLIAAAWTGTKYQKLSAMEAENTRLSQLLHPPQKTTHRTVVKKSEPAADSPSTGTSSPPSPKTALRFSVSERFWKPWTATSSLSISIK